VPKRLGEVRIARNQGQTAVTFKRIYADRREEEEEEEEEG
jgi:hypothetical protein